MYIHNCVNLHFLDQESISNEQLFKGNNTLGSVNQVAAYKRSLVPHKDIITKRSRTDDQSITKVYWAFLLEFWEVFVKIMN